MRCFRFEGHVLGNGLQSEWGRWDKLDARTN